MSTLIFGFGYAAYLYMKEYMTYCVEMFLSCWFGFDLIVLCCYCFKYWLDLNRDYIHLNISHICLIIDMVLMRVDLCSFLNRFYLTFALFCVDASWPSPYSALNLNFFSSADMTGNFFFGLHQSWPDHITTVK